MGSEMCIRDRRFTAKDFPANMTTVMVVMVDPTEMVMMDDGDDCGDADDDGDFCVAGGASRRGVAVARVMA